MSLTAAETLRSYLGERIPSGGTDADTLFSDEEIDDILVFQGPVSNLWLAAAEGWRRKAALYGDLADQQVGGSTRTMSEIHAQALQEEDRFRKLASGADRMRIGKIRRSGSLLR